MKAFNLADVLTSDTIFFDMKGDTRSDLIRRICERLADRDEVVSAERMAEAAIEREEELPTGIEKGIALPHARTNAVKKLVCAFIRPATPIDFSSPDGEPSDLIFFSAIPTDCVDEYLRLTAGLIRKLHTPGVIDELRNANTTSDILKALGIQS